MKIDALSYIPNFSDFTYNNLRIEIEFYELRISLFLRIESLQSVNRKESLELIPFYYFILQKYLQNNLTKRTCVKRYHTYRSSLEHVAVAGRNDRSIIERHTRRETVRVHVGWNPQRHQRRNTFTLAEQTSFTYLSSFRNKLSFRFDTFFFREKQKFSPPVERKSCRMNDSSEITT